MKISLYDYPESCGSRFIEAFGECLPFEDESFDIVSSYQTLEHISDVKACVKEMLRVVRKKGHFSSFSGFPMCSVCSVRSCHIFAWPFAAVDVKEFTSGIGFNDSAK